MDLIDYHTSIKSGERVLVKPTMNHSIWPIPCGSELMAPAPKKLMVE